MQRLCKPTSISSMNGQHVQNIQSIRGPRAERSCEQRMFNGPILDMQAAHRTVASQIEVLTTPTLCNRFITCSPHRSERRASALQASMTTVHRHVASSLFQKHIHGRAEEPQPSKNPSCSREGRAPASQNSMTIMQRYAARPESPR